MGESGGDVGWFLYCTVLRCYNVITAIEYLFLALLTTVTGLLSAYIVWKVIQPGLERFVADKERTIPAQMKKQLKSFMDEQLEGVDLGEMVGQIGGEGGGLGDIAGLLGGKGGGLGDLLKLFAQFSGKGKEGGDSLG